MGSNLHDFSVTNFTTFDRYESSLPTDLVIYYLFQVVFKITSGRDICCVFRYHKKLPQR